MLRLIEKTKICLANEMSGAVLDSLASQIAVIDGSGFITYVNRAWCDFAISNGMPAEHQWVGTNYLHVCHNCIPLQEDETDGAKVYAGIIGVIEGDASAFVHEYPCHSSIEKRWFLMRIGQVWAKPGHFVISHHNITARVLAEQQIVKGQAALRESEERYRTLIEWSPEAIGVHRGGIFLFVNPAAVKMFGATCEQDIVGKPLLDFVHPEFHQVVLARAFVNTPCGETTPRVFEKFLKIDGAVIDVEIQSTSIFYNGLAAVQLAVRDVTQRRLADEEIRRLAFYDPLTNLPNRRLLMDRLKQAISSSCRTGQHGALMFLDLDHFKSLNDRLGHSIGDELLKQVAARLQFSVREADSVARLGGDEFVVLLEALSTQDDEATLQTEAIANKILVALGQPYFLQEHIYNSTPSMGVVVFLQDHENMDELIRRADVAMYQSKAAGRNTLRFYRPID